MPTEATVPSCRTSLALPAAAPSPFLIAAQLLNCAYAGILSVPAAVPAVDICPKALSSARMLRLSKLLEKFPTDIPLSRSIPALQDFLIRLVGAVRPCARRTSTAAQHVVNSVYDNLARPTSSSRVWQRSTTASALPTPSPMSWPRTLSWLGVWSGDRMKARPTQIWIRWYVSARCILKRNRGPDGSKSRQTVAAGRECQYAVS